jgi:hypothetical protein
MVIDQQSNKYQINDLFAYSNNMSAKSIIFTHTRRLYKISPITRPYNVFYNQFTIILRYMSKISYKKLKKWLYDQFKKSPNKRRI